MSRMMYHGVRKVAGVTAGILNGGHVEVEPGSIYDLISTKLGEDEYEEVCQDRALVLEAISYCQTELSMVGKSMLAVRKMLVPNFDATEQKKRLLNHDVLILKLRRGVPEKPVIYILAEKGGAGEDGSKPGIQISILEGGEDMERKCCLRRIECCTQICLLDLTAILKKVSPDYDLMNDNCWDYARKTTKFLLEACIQRKSDGCEEQKRLQRELKHLESHLLTQHVVNTGERMVKYGKSHVLNEFKFS